MNHKDDSQEFTIDINASLVKCCHVSIWMLMQSLGTHVPPKSEYINMFSKQGVLKKKTSLASNMALEANPGLTSAAKSYHAISRLSTQGASLVSHKENLKKSIRIWSNKNVSTWW